MVMGDPLCEQTEIGTLISQEQRERVGGYVEEARKLPGAQVIQVGELPTQPPFDRGLFYKPTIVVNPPPDCRLVQEEIFGPVAAVLPWQDSEELLRKPTPPGMAYPLAS